MIQSDLQIAKLCRGVKNVNLRPVAGFRGQYLIQTATNRKGGGSNDYFEYDFNQIIFYSFPFFFIHDRIIQANAIKMPISIVKIFCRFLLVRIIRCSPTQLFLIKREIATKYCAQQKAPMSLRSAIVTQLSVKRL